MASRSPNSQDGPRARARPQGTSGRSRRALAGLARWSLVLGIWCAVGLGGIIAWYAWDLPELSSLEAPARRPSVLLRTADGAILARYGQLYGGPALFGDLPDYFIQAVSATEDRRFFEHPGIDVLGVVRAAIANIRAGGIRQGGSTITQQLAKNLFLSPERTIRRKIQEAILALWLEARFTKRQIFAIYVNRAYFGSGAYGVRAAARRYFGKPVERISLLEAAVLAGLLKAPSRYSPVRDIAAATARGHRVLAAMVDAGMLSRARADAARRDRLRLLADTGPGARYFTDWTLARLTGYVGPAARDLFVTTTLDSRLQRLAERESRALLDVEGRKSDASQVAVIVMSTNGAVRAMVGGRAYSASQFNRATQALRQPGSAFKLFVYLAGLETGIAPSHVFVDKPVSVAGWSPRNYDGRFRGPVSIERAFVESINTVAVRVSERVGRRAVLRTARRLGITTPLKSHPSLALGANEMSLIELTAAYAAVANGGFAVWPFGVSMARTADGKVYHRRAGTGARRVIPAERAAVLQSMLRAVVRSGTGRAARMDGTEAGKTGTSQGFRDAWFIGFSGDLVAGVWVGNDDGRPMREVTGGGLPARIWRAVMDAARPRNQPVPGAGAVSSRTDSDYSR